MNTILTIVASGAAFYVGAMLLSGVKITSFVQALIVAVVVALLNATLGFALKVLTLGLLSLGIFKLILSAIIIQAADYLLQDFEVRNFWWALGLAAIVAVVNSLITGLF